MKIVLPSLPYPTNALEPHISQQTLEYHYGKHHRGYVEKLQKLITDKVYEDMDVEEIILEAFDKNHRSIFNNAAQVWNHNFYWKCMAPTGTRQDFENYDLQTITNTFGSIEEFKSEFTRAAKKLFGSGWTWLVKEADGSLAIINTKNADTPLAHGLVPILTCDVWEHAYYLDYQNARGEYLKNFWKLVNWEFVQENLAKPAMKTSKDSQNNISHSVL